MNTKHLAGQTVVSIDEGEKLGSVGDVVLDATGMRVAGFAIQSGGGLLSVDPAATRWIAADEVRAIGPDALTVQSGSRLSDASPPEGVLHLAEVVKHKVVTEGGTEVGQVASVEFDERTMAVTHLEVSPGFFKSNRMVPLDQVVNVGHELVIVRDAVLATPGDAEEPAVEHRHVVGDIEPRSTGAES